MNGLSVQFAQRVAVPDERKLPNFNISFAHSMFDQIKKNSASNVHLMVIGTSQSAKLNLNRVGLEK